MIERIDATNFNNKKAKLLNDIGKLIEVEAMIRAPVKTGLLRSSINYVVENDVVSIGTHNCSYANFVEFGTNVMIKAHGVHDPMNPVTDWEALRKRGGSNQTMPFLRTAIFLAEPKIMELFKNTFN